jgi:peptidoglycan-associated lipoprotein
LVDETLALIDAEGLTMPEYVLGGVGAEILARPRAKPSNSKRTLSLRTPAFARHGNEKRIGLTHVAHVAPIAGDDESLSRALVACRSSDERRRLAFQRISSPLLGRSSVAPNPKDLAMKLDSISHNVLQSLALGAFVSLTLACGAENKAAPRPAEPAQPPPPAVVAAPKEPPPPPSVVVSKDIRDACGLAEPEAYFDYKSSKLRQQDQTFLKSLAHCFSAGPLRKKEIHLVGHTDPRGSESYNHELGQQRANNVKTAMLNLGLPSSQIVTSSRGKRDAAGHDDVSWARDRRVEAKLGR